MMGGLDTGRGGERLEHAAPEAFQVTLQLQESRGIHSVETPRAFLALFHQSSRFQHLQVLRDRGAADRKQSRQLANRKRATPEPLENRAARGVGECREHLSLVGHG